MQLTNLIYSSNHAGLEQAALDSILNQSRRNNKRDNITGVLIASEEDFMQLLEGERGVVAACFQRIMHDKRHQGIRILHAEEVEDRLFAKWSMHCIEASTDEKEILSGYLIKGSFDAPAMSQAAIEDLCQAMSVRIWEERVRPIPKAVSRKQI